jgi:hypothetical protein
MLLLDCLMLWEVQGQVEAADDGLAVIVPAGRFLVRRADPELRPVRWFIQTPQREIAGRQPRAVPAIGALLASLRNALGAAPGSKLRIGA